MGLRKVVFLAGYSVFGVQKRPPALCTSCTKNRRYFFLSSLGERHHDLDGEQLSAGSVAMAPLYFWHDTAGDLQLIAVAASVVGLAAGQRRPMTLMTAKPCRLHTSRSIMRRSFCWAAASMAWSSRFANSAYRSPGSMAASRCHRLRSSSGCAGLTQLGSFGQDDVQHSLPVAALASYIRADCSASSRLCVAASSGCRRRRSAI